MSYGYHENFHGSDCDFVENQDDPPTETFDEYLRSDELYSLILTLQKHCEERCIPIFNATKAVEIFMNLLE